LRTTRGGALANLIDS